MSSIPSRTRTSLPLHWYVFFGIVEPITVAAGCVYAVLFQENVYTESIPLRYVEMIAQSRTAVAKTSVGSPSAWFGVARQAASSSTPASITKPILSEQSRMLMAQLGSCYFLIMLNSALMFYAIRRYFSIRPAEQERVLQYLFVVLGLADWTHILFTIHFLPSPPSLATSPIVAFAAKIWILVRHWSVWNSLLFGNIVITLCLFLARSLWWIGVARDTFASTVLPNTVKSR